jgi:hypothetical protein
MNFEQFKVVIKALEKVRERSHTIYTLGINLSDYDEDFYVAITNLLNCVFTEEGKDWVDWYLYERPGFGNTPNRATDENGNEICHNVESLWETVKPYRKQ